MSFMNIDYKKHMTNGDKIRAMSDEDLAQFICDRTDCPLCDANEYCTTKDGPSNGLLKWLEMEART